MQWSKEYLNTLQQRVKWNKASANVKVGQFVSIIDSSLLKEGRWPLGRIVEVFTGDDGLVRAAKVHTVDGDYVRPILKLSVFPID